LKRTSGEKVFQAFNIIMMIALCIVTIYPYLNQLAMAFNDGVDAMMGGIGIFPRKFTLLNFKVVFSNDSMLGAAFVSVSRVVLSTLLSIVVIFSAAYGITRKGIPFRKGITLYLMIPSYITAGLIPTYMLYRYIHLINNYLVYILPFAYSFYSMVIFRSFLQEIPASIEESAMMDGANTIRIMFKIVVPLSKPVLATVALWCAVGQWNDWTTTLMYVTRRELFPLQYIMMKLIKESALAQEMAQGMNVSGASIQPTSDTIKAATLVVTTIPIIMLYPFLQKYFIKGVTLGAVKE
jgi:putative aldouronate transport system permease protein